MLFAGRVCLIRLLSTVFVISLVACGGNSTSNPTPPNTSAEHLYVTNAAGQILQFNLPLTSSSTPAVIVSNPANPLNVAIAVDSNGNIATGDGAGHLAIYTPPLSSSSTPAVIFNNGTPAAGSGGSLAFSSTGDLFATATSPVFPPGPINLFKHPFSSATTVSQVITDNRNPPPPDFVTSFDEITVDANGNLYIIGRGGSGIETGVFAPPYANFAVGVSFPCCETDLGPLAAGQTLLFTVKHTSDNHVFIDVDQLPSPSSFVGASIPIAQSGSAGTATGLAVDSAGNLYVGDNNDNTIRVFTPPFSSSSVPTVTLSLAFSPGGMAVGK